MIRHFQSSLQGMKSIELLAEGDSFFHRAGALPKLIFTLGYIVTVVSFPVYGWSGLLIFFLYPAIAVAIADIPGGIFLRRTAAALPFVVFAGVANVILDRSMVNVSGAFALPGGVVSFAVLLLKTFLAAGAALILAATTRLDDIAGALRQCRVPCVLVLLLLLIWRYLEVLIGEASNMVLAYRMRSGMQKAVRFSDWPKLTGLLLLRSIERAEKIYQSMQCRLFDPRHSGAAGEKLPICELLFAALLVAVCVFFRFFNFSVSVGNWLL